jgi:hypothetical protein
MSVQDFKPAIRVKAVVDAVFKQTGYTYSSSFFNEDWFQDVYMVCNNGLKYPEYAGVDLETYGIAKIAAISGSGMTDLNLPDNTTTQLPWYNVLNDPQGNIGANASYYCGSNSKLEGTLSLTMNVSCSLNNVPSRWEIHWWPTGSSSGGAGSGYAVIPNFSSYFDQLVVSRNGGLNQDFTVSTNFYTSELTQNTNYYFGLLQAKYYSSGAGTPKVTLDPNGNPKSFLQISKVNQAADGRIMDIPSNMPYGTKGIRLVDFISGLQKKFHLVMYPDNTQHNHFIIETFNNWYIQGEVKDFNKYINLDETIEVIPANNFAVNNLNFGDSLDTDYVSQQFYKGANREFGKSYYVDTQNYFSQGTFEVKTTFASDPLLKIPNTGLSGSASGLNPIVVAYAVYDGAQLYFSNSPYSLCSSSNPIRIIYSTTGLIEESAVLYYDAYGSNLVTGYSYVTDRASSGCKIYELSPSTGIVGYYTGQTCADNGGGCI